MKKLTITKDFGNFDVTATTEVTDVQAETLISLGALYIFERQPSSGVEQKVFGPMLGWSAGKRGTSLKRPQGFKRNSVPFSKELAQKIAEAYGRTPGKLGDTELKFTVTSCVEHIGGTETATKEGIALWEQVQGLPEDEFNGACVKLGIDPEDYDDDKGIAACMAHLRKLKAEVSAKALGALKG
jgi:hypothetical protein